MKSNRGLIGIVLALICIAFLVSFFMVKDGNATDKSGETLFKENCAVCHPQGGNIINPKKTLMKKDLQANNVRKEEDIMKIMRNPGPGMSTFDQKTIPDMDAKKIAEYILKQLSH